MTSWYVYVLVSEVSERTYVGITTDVDRRLLEHNGDSKGGAKATRGHRPWKVGKIFGPLSSRSAACKLEWRVKQKKGKDRLKDEDS